MACLPDLFIGFLRTHQPPQLARSLSRCSSLRPGNSEPPLSRADIRTWIPRFHPETPELATQLSSHLLRMPLRPTFRGIFQRSNTVEQGLRPPWDLGSDRPLSPCMGFVGLLSHPTGRPSPPSTRRTGPPGAERLPSPPAFPQGAGRSDWGANALRGPPLARAGGLSRSSPAGRDPTHPARPCSRASVVSHSERFILLCQQPTRECVSPRPCGQASSGQGFSSGSRGQPRGVTLGFLRHANSTHF